MITFGIITDGTQNDRVDNIIASIKKEGGGWYDAQVVVVGGQRPAAFGVVHIPFKEKYKNNDKQKGWITKKKNLITQYAKFENIVYMHDYIILHHNWFVGFNRFCREYKWDVCMNRINNTDSTRYRDWAIWDDPTYKGFPQVALPSYSYNKTQYMYVSGAYWVAKKYVMEDLPLNEELHWCDGEDVEWSQRMRQKYKYVFNPYSQVDLMKYKELNARRCY